MRGVLWKSGWGAWGAFRIAVILMISAVVGMAGILTVVSNGIDDHQRDKEMELVTLRLARALELVGEELTTASTWDEAAQEMSAGDIAWFDKFLGGFYAVQHHHLASLGYDSDGRLIRISRAGRAAGADANDPFARTARPLVDRTRAEAASRDRSTQAMDAVRVNTAFVQIDGVVYVLGVSTIVRHTDLGPVPASDPLVASYKPFLPELTVLRTRLALTGVHFQPGSAPAPDGMVGVAVRDADGGLLGQVVWAPERPGYQILTRAGPLMLVLLLVLGVGGGTLLWRTAADVRRLRVSETALSAALERAEAANAAKTRFLSNVSHELRTPLNGVLGMAEIIGQDLVTPKQKERLEILKASGNQQLRMIEELLDVVRLGDGKVALETQAFRPEALLRRLAAEHRGQAAAKGLILAVSAPKGEWIGDPVHIEKLLSALVHNAIRFTARGEVGLSAVGGDGLSFEVRDTGPGMSRVEAARLFDAFAQGDESRTRAADGLGLGLTVAHGLATLMGGRIEVESVPGEGSLFRVVLPLQPVRSSADAAV